MILHTMFSIKKNDHENKVFRNTKDDNNSDVHFTTKVLNTATSNNSNMLTVLASIYVFIRRWIVVILAVLAPIAFLIYYNATHFSVIIEKDHISISPNNPSGMTDAVAAIIVTGLASLMALIFNPILAKKYDSIKVLIDNHSKANELQFNGLSTILTEHGKLFNSILTVKDIRTVLNTIVSNSLVYSEDRKLSEWVAKEGKAFVEFCGDTLLTGINNINCKSFKADVNVLITISITTTKDYLTNDFLKIIEKEHVDRMIGFRNDVLIISNDRLMNSKTDRFRAKAEIFLQEYLASTIIAYNKFNK